MLRDMSSVLIALMCLLLFCFTLTFFTMFLQFQSSNFRPKRHFAAQFQIGFEDDEKLKAWPMKKTMHGPPFFLKTFLYLVQAE